MDHHGDRTLADTCPKPAQAPHDAIPRPRPPISNRESTPIISNRESRVGTGVNVPPALASGVRLNAPQQEIALIKTKQSQNTKNTPQSLFRLEKIPSFIFFNLAKF
jgi:hypothetical protein